MEPYPQPDLHLLFLLLNYKFIQHKTISSRFIEVADHAHDKAASEQEPYSWANPSLGFLVSSGVPELLLNAMLSLPSWILKFPTLWSFEAQPAGFRMIVVQGGMHGLRRLLEVMEEILDALLGKVAVEMFPGKLLLSVALRLERLGGLYYLKIKYILFCQLWVFGDVEFIFTLSFHP